MFLLTMDLESLLCHWWLSTNLQEVNGVLKSLEEALADVQRVDTKAQSALDLKKQNQKDETKKRKDIVKSMEEVLTL